MSQTLTPEEAGRMIGKSPATLARWRAEGVGPAYVRIGGTFSYRRSDIEAFLAASRVEPARATRHGHTIPAAKAAG